MDGIILLSLITFFLEVSTKKNIKLLEFIKNILLNPMILSILIGAFIFLINNSFAADADKGKKLFTKCKACHNADAEKHKIGPKRGQKYKF